MAITTDQVKELRDKTGVSIMQCKKALEDSNGDMEQALVLLKKKGAEIADKKSDRDLGAGVVQAYIHTSGNIGAMVELWCETDFVAKNEEFKALAYDIAMQVAATKPEFLSMNDVGEDAKKKAEEVFTKELEGKPENMKAQILEGKINSYFKEMVLLEQPFIKNDSLTVAAMISNGIQKFGEKIVVGKFARFTTKV
jgi:elongation factor Ts